MEAKIVVEVANTADVEEVISCCEFLAKPGMTVILLLRSPLRSWDYIRDHWITVESTRAAIEQGRQSLTRYSSLSQRALAEQRFAPVTEALGKRRVAVQIDHSTESLKQKLQAYGADPQVFSIVRYAGSRRPVRFLLHRVMARFRPIQSSEFIPSWSLLRVSYRSRAREQGLVETGSRNGFPLA
jgi:hypothetical protein